MDKDHAGIAQLVEQLICNHQVPCSIHGTGTNFQSITTYIHYGFYCSIMSPRLL